MSTAPAVQARPARSLVDFIGIHAGETAWLFGKGPSLDRFDMAQAGPLRVAINDVVKEVPGCRYGFANDAVHAWAHVYQPEHVLFVPSRTQRDSFQQNWGGPPALPCEVVEFADDYDDERLYWPAERVAREGLTIRPGTLGSAVQILALMGVKKIVCVGIDGGRVHAQRDWFTSLRNDHARDYGHIREQFKDAAWRLRLEVEFFGRSPDLNPNDTMTIRILVSCLIDGSHHPAGAIADVDANTASVLIGQGSAQAVSKEELAALEAKRAPATTESAAATPEVTSAATPAVEAAAASPVVETAAATPPRAEKKTRAPKA